MNKDILLEIGTEEIPDRYLPSIIERLRTISETELKLARLSYKNMHIWATLRRMILYCEDIDEHQIALETEISGPSEKIAFVDGKPNQIAFGFAKKYGVDVSELMIKNGKVCVIKKEPSLKTEIVLPEVFKKIISSLTFPKTMVWGFSRFRFVRPIRWILSLYGKKTIKFQIADVKSSNLTCARYSYGKKIKITEPKKYSDILRNKSVIVNQIDRLDSLKKTVAASIKNISQCEILASDEFFETVNNLVEFPTSILCEFDKKFLNLPEEIIISVLKKQKNFIIGDSKTKKILTYFVGVKDGISTNLQIIKEGYEKVITARLEDAEFYFRNDTKTKLEEKIDQLKGIVFQEKLGTIYDKIQRIKKIANWLNNNISAYQHISVSTLERLCLLCKADLSTETVSEFPELQGIFGKICALKDGEDKDVADGIFQHWWPINYEGEIPVSIEASVVSIADKIDTLAGNFACGFIPTGSADPYGLRRVAFGIVKIAIEKKISFSVKELIIHVIENLPFKVNDVVKITSQLNDFLKQRLNTYLKEKDILQDEIDAVFSIDCVDIFDIYNRVVSLHSIRKLPDFLRIATSFKRIGNILKQVGKEQREENRELKIREELLKEPEEKELYQKFLDVQNKIKEETDRMNSPQASPQASPQTSPQNSPQTKKNNYITVLQKLVLLREPIDNFFDKILIMDKDEQIKTNRLMLLFTVYNQFIKIADFSKIVVDSKDA
ncbi:MAG: glycine--tRNA ligase subunit beta [Elusimicrobiota bacterium]